MCSSMNTGQFSRLFEANVKGQMDNIYYSTETSYTEPLIIQHPCHWGNQNSENDELHGHAEIVNYFVKIINFWGTCKKFSAFQTSI